MKLPVRLLFCALTMSIGLVTSAQPGEASRAVSHKMKCCAETNMGGCDRCPNNTGGTNSGFGSTCCGGQAGCCWLYFADVARFVIGMKMIGKVGISNERVTTRAQRPPVPPPRIAFS